jgi:endo-1,4-beta-xylanase
MHGKHGNHKKQILSALLFIATAMFPVTAQTDSHGLKDYYSSFFPVGVAVSPQVLTGPEAELIKKHFNSMTAENVMKIGPIHPEEDRFNWEPADQVVAFALSNGMKMRGHTLCWHNQTPAWLFKDAAGNQVTKDVLLLRLKDHITAVVSRYKGKIYAWDVVNEAIDDKDDVFYRQSPWYTIIGEEYIAKAFEYAHAADPNALLFYNDYNTESPSKRAKIIKLLKSLMEAGVPIHGMGIQGHWSIFGPNDKEIEESIRAYSALGLKIQITELDVSVYQSEQGRREKRPDEQDVFTPEMEVKQIEVYKSIFKAFREYKNVITTVTFWNVTDKRSWLDNFPVRGRKNYPLLFDKDLKPKKAYWEVVKFDKAGEL